MAAVAKRLVLRLAASTKSNVLFAGRESKLIAQMVNDFNRDLNQQRAILSAANHNRLGHRFSSIRK
jgi:hypothetical protein